MQILPARLRLTIVKGSSFGFIKLIARARNLRTRIPSNTFGCAGNVLRSTRCSMQKNAVSCSRIAPQLPLQQKSARSSRPLDSSQSAVRPLFPATLTVRIKRDFLEPRNAWIVRAPHSILSRRLTKSRIILRRSDLECGSLAAAFPNNSHDRILGEAQSLDAMPSHFTNIHLRFRVPGYTGRSAANRQNWARRMRDDLVSC